MAQPEYPVIDPSTVAPLNDDGKPDLYNHLPTRFVPASEAKARGWPTFYDGSTCRYGHQAPRYVSNVRLCVDCHRIKSGKTPIGAKAAGPPEYKRQYKQREVTPAAPVVLKAAEAPEPDAKEKRFLEAYATHRDFDMAARGIGRSPAEMESRMAYSAVFKSAVNALEDRLGIKKSFPAADVYVWSAEKRSRFVQVYIDTGDQASARDAIRVTPSEYFAEFERNPEFADAVRGAEPLAAKALEERAIQLALAGNDKLLTKVLSAKLPEYRERLDLNVRQPEKLSDQQLENRLAHLFAKHRERLEAIDADYVVVEPERKALTLEGTGGAGPAGEPQPHSDIL